MGNSANTCNCRRLVHLSEENRRQVFQRRSQVADLNALLNNNLQGITTIKSFTAEERKLRG